MDEFRANLCRRAKSIQDFIIQEKIGGGTYGQIVTVSPVVCDEYTEPEEGEDEEQRTIKEKMKYRFVAKFDEKKKLEGIEKQDPQIKNEQWIYQQLWNLSEAEKKKMNRSPGLKLQTGHLKPFGVPRMYCKGETPENHYLVIDRLGVDLNRLLEFEDNRHPKTKRFQFPLFVGLQIGLDLIRICQYIHSCGIVHRDLKPENIVLPLFFLNEDSMETISQKELHLSVVDFGLSSSFIEWNASKKCYQHAPLQRFYKSIDGTTRYASLNTHFGYSPSRRDDLETIGYILLYFLNGTLPWSGILDPLKKVYEEKESNHRWQNKVALIKSQLSLDLPKLCHLDPQKEEEEEAVDTKKLIYQQMRQITSVGLQKFFSQVYQLKYDQYPDYDSLLQCFTSSLEQMGKLREQYFEDGKFEDVLSKEWMFMGVSKFFEAE